MRDDPVRWLYGLQQFGIKLGLESVRTTLDRLGHPERSFHSVLVGGTNGKGSVAAMLDAMLAAHGVKGGLYTSPHLVRPNERIRIGGCDIPDADFHRHLDAVRTTVESAVADGSLAAHPSFFEVMTATALLAFREAGVEAAVLEVGLGGRLDATNAVEAGVSVIVTVDLDHTDRLGTSLEQIAAEKAGIVKQGRSLVSGVVQEEARAVLRRACEDHGSPFVEARRVAALGSGRDGTFSVETPGATYAGLDLPLPGRHQRENARVAIVAAELFAADLSRAPNPEKVHQALRSVRWPGRLQWFEGDPAILLDGAHNPAGAATLAGYLRERGGSRPVLVFGAVQGKDMEGILAPLAGLVESAILTRPPVERGASPDELAGIASRLLGRVETRSDPAEALDRARTLVGSGGFVLVAGSLYLVGAILGLLEGDDGPGPVSM